MVLADGNGQSVVIIGAQDPVLRIVGEDDAVGAQLVDEGGCPGRACHLSWAAVPRGQGVPGWLASRMAIAARCGMIWSSRT